MGKIMFRVLEIHIENDNQLNIKTSSSPSVHIQNQNTNLDGGNQPSNNGPTVANNNTLRQINGEHNSREETFNHNYNISNSIVAPKNEGLINDLSGDESGFINKLTPCNSDVENPLCRICLSEPEDDNPLICPCNCTGSIMFIHVQCLINWLKSRESIKEYKNLTVITFKNSKCELCKVDFPDRIKVKEKIYNLLSAEKPANKHYIIFEGFFWETKDVKNWYILRLEKHQDRILFGRANYCDVRMSCISVSRDHAVIRLHKGRFILEDLGSKFGTLVLLTTNVSLIPYHKLSIQYHNCFITYQVKSNFIGKCCGFIKPKIDYNFYNELLNKSICKPELGRLEIKKVKCHYDYEVLKGYSHKQSRISDMLIKKFGKLDQNVMASHYTRVINCKQEVTPLQLQMNSILEEENKEFHLEKSDVQSLMKSKKSSVMDMLNSSKLDRAMYDPFSLINKSLDEKDNRNEIIEYIKKAGSSQ